jgi:hypothetical protein
MQDQQVVISRDDRIGSCGHGQFEKLVVVRVPARGHRLGWFQDDGPFGKGFEKRAPPQMVKCERTGCMRIGTTPSIV